MMRTQRTSFAIFVGVALVTPSAWADEKPAPKPDGIDARLERIADQVAAHEVLRGVFGKEVKTFGLDWLARSDQPAKYQFALSIRMATRSTPQPRDEEHAKLVASTIRLATVLSEQEVRVKSRLLKDEDWLVAVLKERATQLSDEKNAKNLMTLEARYHETITAADAVDLVRYAGQTPKEFLAVRQQLRDALVKTLRKQPDIAKLFPPPAEASAELLKSRKRVTDLLEEAEKKKAKE